MSTIIVNNTKANRLALEKSGRVLQGEGAASLKTAAKAMGVAGDFVSLPASFGLMALWKSLTAKQRQKLLERGQAELEMRLPAASDKPGPDVVACLDPTCPGIAEIVPKLLALGMRRVRSGKRTLHDELRGFVDVDAVREIVEAANGTVSVINHPAPPLTKAEDNETPDDQDVQDEVDAPPAGLADPDAGSTASNEADADRSQLGPLEPSQATPTASLGSAFSSSATEPKAKSYPHVEGMKPSNFLGISLDGKPEGHSHGAWTKQHEGVD